MKNKITKNETEKKHIGKVYRGKTKYIDPEPKRSRRYVVVKESKKGNVGVSKLKSIKEDVKNPNLIEINHKRYGLEKRTGVDKQVYERNRMSKKPLKIDEEVFETPELFKLGSHDLHNALEHTKRKKKDDK